MVEVGKILLMYIAGITVGKNYEVKNCRGIEEGSICGDCEDDFMNMEGRIRQVKIS